jgi:tRNA(Ile2) C34 agmatinyltransferase TiaS
MSVDKLELIQWNLSVCPNCGCIDQKGAYRCLGCGTFHSGAHLVEREAPPVAREDIDVPIVEPSAYSIGPKGEIS